MPKPDYVVVGAGPAGAALAHFLSQRGYRVAVVEAAPRPAMKPCGWMVPVQVEEHLRVPGEAVLNTVKGFRVVLDGEVVGERYGGRFAYLVDRPRLAQLLLEGVETLLSAPARTVKGLRVELPSATLEAREAVVIATGHYWWRGRGDHIMAVQSLYRLRVDDPSVAEIVFDRNLVGYYWVFPVDERTAKIGVGGYASYGELVERLNRFALEKGAEPVKGVEGARIYVGGVDENALNGTPPRVGEAAGFVFPISGEGIRPSIASARALAALLEGDRATAERIVVHLAKWIRRQRRLLLAVRRASPELRAAVLRSLDPDDAVGIALGTLPVHRLLRIAARAVTGAVARVFMELASD